MKQWVLITACLFALPAFSQNMVSEKISVLQTSEIIKLDGKLNEAAWQSAKPYSEFMQSKPRPGIQPSENTSFRVLYNNEFLYLGVMAYDKEPGKIVASGYRRDSWSEYEDGITISIDTYNDKSHATNFYANTLGAKNDGEKSGNEDAFNSSFNTFWDVAVFKNTEGYSMEFRIPFSSLRFKTADKIIMGFKLIRQIGRKNEFIVFPKSDSMISNITWRISNEAEIEFTGLHAKKPFYLIPYARMNYSETNQLNQAGNTYQKQSQFMQANSLTKNKSLDKIISNIGVDVKYGLSKNFTLDATLNTDFAQAEVDSRIINLTRFGVNLPEKRNFFLEANDFLNFSIVPEDVLLFNSRNIGIGKGKIVPIIGGLRVTGKANGYQLGLLNMQTGGISEEGINPENFTVARLRKDLFKNGSFMGGFFANRSTTNKKELSNQTAGFDFYHRVNDFWSYGFNLAATNDIGLSWFKDKNNAANFFVMRDGLQGWGHFITGNIISQNFNPQSGFASDKGYKDIFILEGYTWRFGKERKLNSILANISAAYRWRDAVNNYLEFERYAGSVKLYYNNGSRLIWYGSSSKDSIASPWNLGPNTTIAKGIYRMILNDLFWNSATTKKIQFELNPTIAGFYGGKQFSFSGSMTYIISRHLNAGLKYSYNHIGYSNDMLNGPNDFESHLLSAHLAYSYNTKISAKMLWQYDNLSKTISTNFRFRYNPHEGTDLYIVYNPVLNTNILDRVPKIPGLNNQQVIIKFSTTLNLAK